jgi:hypothetical protein
VRYDEIRNLIISSSANNWAVIVEGSVYPGHPEEVISGETKGHAYLAVYKADVNLRLAWGMTAGTDTHLAFKTGDFADPSIERQLVDGFWRGALVTRSSVLSADGHRRYLPIPEFTFSARVADPPTVKTSEVALARLLNRLAGRDARDLDARLERAEVVVVPD